MEYPKVIFLDAVGTLFGVKGTVGLVYSDLARTAGVEVDPATLDWAFHKSFAAAEKMAFPDVPATNVPGLEYRWWRTIVRQTFERARGLEQFADFDTFFDDVYTYFTTAAPWQVYPDTLPSLQRWQGMGIELGIISNFDSRLYSVLEALGMVSYFKSVTLSAEAGAVKPDPLIFQKAIQKHDCGPELAWHVGDSRREDYEGARTAGLKAILLKRPALETAATSPSGSRR
ncbi:HAD-IA family hydrolase [Romeria aff. gracilis LEGE 07310]|uniref:HAD-IA family hydrolase n=1 Tax=Vasconcelosia minhoensis LEGE 07310 TaxID=915328 RepID=A0A8J7DCW7_9CYAN|nr:HAD-IA family hydrolase [Romeria gracilis]MBE9078113.1 HAD-IA family hydrolase [Romeria aff. gracilis LEGE 07310]